MFWHIYKLSIVMIFAKSDILVQFAKWVLAQLYILNMTITYFFSLNKTCQFNRNLPDKTT